MNDFKISVITVCYNAVNEIERTMLSVLNQTYRNIEYIVIDGGSTDGTVDIIKKYTDRLAHWVSEPDKGIYDAMNKGINVATGDYINFMNAGDSFFESNVLKSVVNFIENDAIIVYGQVMKVYNRFQFVSPVGQVELDGLKQNVRLPHQGMFTKSKYQKSHLFDTAYRSAADYNFYYHAHFIDNCKFQFLPIIVANYDSETGMSKTNYIGTMEALLIQGKNLNETDKRKLIIRYKILNFFKRILPESIKTSFRKSKFSKAGYRIIKK